MNDEQKALTLAMAHRVLGEDNPSRPRVEWARDVIAALERGDAAAARRQQIPLEALPQQTARKAA